MQHESRSARAEGSMSGPKSILVHVDASAASLRRLRIAANLGRACEAEVTAVYAVASLGAEYPYIYVVGSPESVALVRDMEEANLASARKAFDSVAKDSERLHWTAPTTEPLRTLVRQGRYADLMVLGQRDPDNPPEACLPADFVESVLIDSGRPALVVPYVGVADNFGKVALVAWKNTRESARALSAALPLLRRCDQVHVVACEEEGGAERESPLDIERYLCLQGIGIRMHRRNGAPESVGDALLSLAADTSADLLVMGCYGHTRAREWVLGGATRTVLKSMTLPVLMAH
jgi:nucleotide-binding universal stress UspA family protein